MAQQFTSVEESLKKHLPEEDKKEVFRILYGRELELVFPL
jgi:beta-ureidopropionase